MKPEDMADGIRGRLNPAATPAAPMPEAVPLPRIADHTMLARIGGGSYGDVWLARSTTGQLRAVKVVWRQNFSSERPYEREFHGIVQFEPISRSHPGVVSVLHVGRDDAAGCFFYVMELADAVRNPNDECRNPKENLSPNAEEAVERFKPGASALVLPSTFDIRNSSLYIPRTLSSDLKAHGRLPVPEVLRLGVQLADALGHLHRHGLVHRDVKPSNVIFVHGQPKLADIGLVTTVSEARSFVGTEGFIPPEGPGTEKADLFALGRLLYEAATGKDRSEFPHLPEGLENWSPSEREALLELNEVLAKLCAPDLSDRHDNAAEVAGDLNLLLAGRSVRRAYGIERRLRRATQVSGAALAVVALAAGLVGFQRIRQHEAETRARQERALRERAEAAEREVRGHLYTALLEQARGTVRSGELGQRVRALDAIRSAAAISNTVELRREAFAALALPDLRFVREVASTKGLYTAFDPAFERLAVSLGRGPVEVRSLSDHRLLHSLPAATNLEAHLMTWSPDGRFLAFKRDWDGAGYRADLEVWDVLSTQRVVFARDRVGYRALSFHPRSTHLMAGRSDGQVAVLDLPSGRTIHQFSLGPELRSLSFAPDGAHFAAAYRSATNFVVSIHEVNSGRLLHSNIGLDQVLNLAWHPEGRWFAVPDTAGNVRLLDPNTGEERTLGKHKAQAVHVTFSPDGDFLVSGGWELELICWDLRTMQRAFTIGVNAWVLAFRRDGRQCVVQPPADRLRVYDFEAPSACRQLPEDLGRVVVHGDFSNDGHWLAATGDQSLGVWDLRTRSPAAKVPGGKFAVPFFSPAASELYAYGADALARWQVTPAQAETSPQLTNLPLLVPPSLRAAAIVSNELVMSCRDAVRSMPPGNVESGNVRRFPGTGGWGEPSPDGRWLGVRFQMSPLMRIYRLPEVELETWLTNRATVWGFRFSPRGDELMVATQTGLECYDTSTWMRTRELAVPCERHASIIFNPNGESFWFTSDNRTSSLRDTRTLEVLLPLPSGMRPLALSGDGRHLAVSLDMRRLQVWDLGEVRDRFRELGLDWPSQ